MPFFYKIDKERKLVMSTAAGEFTKADVLLLQDQLRGDPDFDPNFALLSDLTHVTSMGITEPEMKEFGGNNGLLTDGKTRAPRKQ
jgi:hypothetical protein